MLSSFARPPSTGLPGVRSRPLRIATAGIVLVLLATSCGGREAGSASEPGDPGLGHIHGIGVDPADQTLYVASHFGLFRVRDGRATRVADRLQDTMGFAVVGDHHFLGSGHPDLQENLPASLGLIESTDAGETWQALALQGSADFHALEPTPDALYAYDTVTGTVMASSDRRSFRILTRVDALDLAVDPADSRRLLASTPQGVQVIDAASGRRTSRSGPLLAFLDWPRPELLVGLAPAGQVHVSDDGGEGWRRVGAVPGRAHALEVTEHTWYAASTEGLFGSSDGGRTWEQIPADIA